LDIPLLDLKAQDETIREEIIAATMEVYQSQRFILGPKAEELERKIAAYTQARYAVGVSSGTDALLISLMSAGIGPGDLVVTSPYTWYLGYRLEDCLFRLRLQQNHCFTGLSRVTV